ncbi:MAG TPA: hypothetical protein VGG63_16375 [Steroidobacteraceae bacterium]|jgi:predicted DNA-binding transcriptional regulator AlpA
MTNDQKATRKPKRLRTAGPGIIYPRGLEVRYAISLSTRWRWEREGRLPARDVFIGGAPIGWRPETIERAERGQGEGAAA